MLLAYLLAPSVPPSPPEVLPVRISGLGTLPPGARGEQELASVVGGVPGQRRPGQHGGKFVAGRGTQRSVRHGKATGARLTDCP